MGSWFGPIIGLLCFGFLALAFGGIGVWTVVQARRSKQKAEASQGWPSVPGEIVEARISRNSHEDSDGDTSYSYSPRLKYTYTVQNQTYTGSQITFGFQKTHASELAAAAALQRYPVGAKVNVFYNPQNPKDAALERKAGGAGAGLVIGIVFIVLSVCILCGGGGALAVSLLANSGGF
jgi:hypothetical protein